MNHLKQAFDGQSQLWKYIVTILIGFVATNFIGILPLLIVMMSKLAQGYSANPDNLLDLSAYGIDLNTGLILMLIPYVIGLIVLVVLFKRLHKRSLSQVINGTKKIRWNRFFYAMGMWALLLAVTLSIEYFVSPQDFKFQFEPTRFLISAVIILIFIPFQTTFEEVLFRGYLMQGLAFWSKNKWIAIISTALIFGLLHSFNPEVDSFGFWLAMPQYIIFGLTFGIMVVLDDGIETAMGAHAANNMFLCLFVTSKESALQTYAVFEKININPSFIDILVLLITSIIFLFILKSKYKWNFSVLNIRKRIEF
ncbi:MAG: CPBP family intramembrane metalloprotease [Bacteroidales bacterium]|nr:CPBP family intramembrane metalloprotease [Bacteroidales bacterium]